MDDGEYFQTLPENTIFLFLRPGELWRPAGTDSIRSGKTWQDIERVFLTNLELFLGSSIPNFKLHELKQTNTSRYFKIGLLLVDSLISLRHIMITYLCFATFTFRHVIMLNCKALRLKSKSKKI